MDKNVILIILAAVMIGGALYFLSASQGGPVKPVPIPEGIILFYGNGCPHCKVVDDFIEANKIKEKVEFSNLEVWYNKNNQNILAQILKKCDMNVKEILVPFLWDGEKCYIGQDDAINFFKQKANIQ